MAKGSTPSNKRLVHWDAATPTHSADDSLSLSLADDSTESSFVSTSSLQYVNSQLVAHGFTSAPGLSLEGISNDDLNRVTKCLMDMLAQRMKDMSRAEQLSTEIRTVNYDYERMKSMHQAASETSANLERELNTQRSRLGTMVKTLQQAENTQKQTMVDLQRTRSSLQTVRATHQAELRKKDKEFERMADKWLKLADAQAKIGAASSGIRFSSTPANASVLTGGQFGKGKGYLETALEQAEKARDQLVLENTGLRMTILRVANEVQKVVHEVKRYLPGNSKDVEDPPAFTLSTLFPLAPADFTNETLTCLFIALEQALNSLESHYHETLASSTQSKPAETQELERLHGVIQTLQTQLKESQDQYLTQTTKTKAMFDEFTSSHRLAAGRTDTVGVGMEHLKAMRQELEEERRAFTEATIQLEKERAELQVEWARLNESKRTDVDMIFEEIPYSTGDEALSPGRKRRSDEDSPPSKKPKIRATRKSPLRSSFGRGLGSSRSKRPSLSASYAVLTSPSKRPPKFEPAFETEVIPPVPSTSTLAPPPSLLPTSFVLPPPSPKASFPAAPELLLSSPVENLFTREESSHPPTSTFTLTPPVPGSLPPPPLPPAPVIERQPYPVAKPLASRMIHAYSPARPSPLSRILRLGNSPDSNTSDDLLDPVPEDAKEDMFPEIPLEDREAAAEVSIPSDSSGEPGLTLAQELGVSESPPESPVRAPSPPLQERNGDPSNIGKSTTARGRVIYAPVEPKRGGASSSKTTKPTTTVPPRKKPPTSGSSSRMKPSTSSGRLGGASTTRNGVKEKENTGKASSSLKTVVAGTSTTTARPKMKPPIPSAGRELPDVFQLVVQRRLRQERLRNSI